MMILTKNMIATLPRDNCRVIYYIRFLICRFLGGVLDEWW